MAFHGKVALITGAASGMGRLAAERLSQAGARVAALDTNAEGLASLARGREGLRAWPVDVTDQSALEAVVKDVEVELGPVDRVLAAAAIMPTKLLLEESVERIHRVMQINYCGVVNTVMSTLPGMLARGRGDMVIFASVAGLVPTLHFGAYNASKFAVVAFSEVLAYENRRSGVRFACVCPPPVATPLLDQAVSKPRILDQMGKPLTPESVLDALERDLERGRFWVFPNARARFSWRFRRWLPGLVWRFDHKVEGI